MVCCAGAARCTSVLASLGDWHTALVYVRGGLGTAAWRMHVWAPSPRTWADVLVGNAVLHTSCMSSMSLGKHVQHVTGQARHGTVSQPVLGTGSQTVCVCVCHSMAAKQTRTLAIQAQQC